jgi:large subunit ribosomal protein L47
MLRPAIRRALSTRLGHLNASRRTLATVAADQPSLNALSSSSAANEMESSTKPGALRPHLGIQVNQNHGLYAFFRKIKDEDSVLGFKYVTYEASNDRFDSASQSQLMADEDRYS